MDGDSTLSIREVKMEDATPSNTQDAADSPSVAVVKNDGAASSEAPKHKPYRSWKKKFQKLRVNFDVSMEANEKLHKEETNALQTTKRLAVEIDRILDLLLDINNTPQIPGSKRIDLSLPQIKGEPALDIDTEGGWERRFVDKNHPDAPPPEPAARSLKSLIADVPHLDLTDTEKKSPARLTDLIVTDDNKFAFTPPDVRPAAKKLEKPEQKPSSIYPESFLTADDLDNYLWDTDRNIAGRALLANDNPPPMVPTMAPFAHTPDTHISHIGNGTTAWEELFNRSIVESDLPKMVNTTPFWSITHTIARNPTSVYNWLRDNAPKAIFLQEGEATAQAAAAAAAAAAAEKEKEKEANGGDSYHHYSGGANGANKRKSTGAGAVKKARGGRVSAVGTSARGGKRASGATSSISREVFADDGAGDAELSEDASANAASARGGKRKRALDDDSGYRAKSGATASSSTRATKRKRKSEGGNGDDDEADASVLSASKKRQRKSDGDGDTEVEGGSDAGEPADEDMEVGDADRDGSSVEA
ncbi:hypothetical protein SEUCBS140593_006110 [Sporothrix eucalyptigena]|uniref:Uncharacterized protein n=1 Tax=Sporothrix eucalyptigena TaxID=1812306 RepID=A0ABP0C369_9PEZI